MRTLSATAARQHLLELLDELEKNPSQIVRVTRRSEPVAALLSADRLDALLETLELLADPKTLKAIRAGQREIRAGRGVPFDRVLKDLGLEER